MTQPTSASLRPAPALLRLGLTAVATAVTLGAIGYWPTVARAGPAGAWAMLVGIGIALVGAWTGVLPTVACLSKPPQKHLAGILLGLGVRFGVTFGLTLAVWLSDRFAQTALLLWVGLAQFVILGVDVYGLTGLLRRSAKEAS